MLKIQTPNTYVPERRYIISVMLGDFLGLDYQFEAEDRRDTRITAGNEGEIIIADGLFSVTEEQWLKPASLPKQPLKCWNLSESSVDAKIAGQMVPVIYGDDPDTSGFFTFSQEKIYLRLDILGSAFFMLSRYEEAVKPERDSRDRFPAYASLAYQEGFLGRPVVNEYLEILWTCLKRLWPALQRKPRHFQIYVSHDVDVPFLFATAGIIQLTRDCLEAAIKQRSLLIPLRNIKQWSEIRASGTGKDPYNTFDLIMDVSERHNLKSAFYFITSRSAGNIDGYYSIEHPLLINLLRKIHQRGHEIGLHSSYNTYRDTAQTKKGFERLKKVCVSLGICQVSYGNRQHYLRWQTPITFQNLEDAGLFYDTTLSFPETAGFRCGVCYEFRAFNVSTRRQLNLRERPLIIMDNTIMDKRNMNLGSDYDVSLQVILKYKKICQIFNGDFTILWHNNRFIKEHDIELYRQIIV